MSEWISVKDTEPPKDGVYFLCYKPSDPSGFFDSGVYVINWRDGTKYWDERYCDMSGAGFVENFTHWMPLPKPPKEKV